MCNLIYVYPKEYGAPSYVATSIFNVLMEKKVSFKISVYSLNHKLPSNLQNQYPDINHISLKEMMLSKEITVTHFPVSPFLILNKKTLFYFIMLLKRSKLIINYHGDPRTEYKLRLKNHNIKEIVLSIPNYLFMPFFLHSAQRVVLNSFSMKRLFEKSYGIENITVIPNGIDSTWFEIDTIKRINFDDVELSLFYHGRLSPEKGVDLLIKGFHLFLKNNNLFESKIKLYIAGDGEQKLNLKVLVDELNIDQYVVFLGKIPLVELKSYMISVNAAIYPSLYEPFSLAVLEAFALVNGPVYYSTKIGLHDFVEQRKFKFNTFEPTEMEISKSIKKIYDKKFDENIHQSQKEFSREFTWENVVCKYEELYKEFF